MHTSAAPASTTASTAARRSPRRTTTRQPTAVLPAVGPVEDGDAGARPPAASVHRAARDPRGEGGGDAGRRRGDARARSCRRRGRRAGRGALRSSSSRTTIDPAPRRWTMSTRRPGRPPPSAAAGRRRRAGPRRRPGRAAVAASRPAESAEPGSVIGPPGVEQCAHRLGERGQGQHAGSSAALSRTGSTSAPQPVASRTRAADAGHTASRAAATCSSVSTSSRWIAATGCTRQRGERGPHRRRPAAAGARPSASAAPGPRSPARRPAGRSPAPPGPGARPGRRDREAAGSPDGVTGGYRQRRTPMDPDGSTFPVSRAFRSGL